MLCAHSKVGIKNSLANSTLAICGLTAFLLFIFISFSLFYVAAIFSFISELFTSWFRILICPVSMWIREDSDYVNPWWSRSETLIITYMLYHLPTYFYELISWLGTCNRASWNVKTKEYISVIEGTAPPFVFQTFAHSTSSPACLCQTVR